MAMPMNRICKKVTEEIFCQFYGDLEFSEKIAI